MSDPGQLEAARAACEQIAGAADGSLEWDWDGRFGTAVAAFGSDVADTVRAALEPNFERSWSPAEIGEAPERVTALAARLSGLRAGQVLWVSSPDAPVLLFCAWWPWGNGVRVSIRIGYDARDGAPDRAELKGWFGL